MMMHANTSNAIAQPGSQWEPLPAKWAAFPSKGAAAAIGVVDVGKSQTGVTVSTFKIYIYSQCRS